MAKPIDRTTVSWKKLHERLAPKRFPCPCGEIHTFSRPVEVMLNKVLKTSPGTVGVECAGHHYRVSRVYIAFHGLKGTELESMVEQGLAQRDDVIRVRQNDQLPGDWQ